MATDTIQFNIGSYEGCLEFASSGHLGNCSFDTNVSASVFSFKGCCLVAASVRQLVITSTKTGDLVINILVQSWQIESDNSQT